MEINNYSKMELLAPVGDFERLYTAIYYGADAVYLGAKEMGMRAGSPNFDFDELKKATEYAHSKNTKVYLTCNTVPVNKEADKLPSFLRDAAACNIDALIVADIGVLMLAKQIVPDIPVHISTQTGIMNYLTATELYKLGASRVVLARELSIEDIKEIREKIPSALEIECFVHGAMCMSISGRCLLSQYMTGRDANRGNCAQPCRWSYYLMEETRPGQYFPVFEDEKGSYILNAKDMNMIEHIGLLADAGINSIKIEGRQKATYYVAVAVNAYSSALSDLQNQISKKAITNLSDYKTPDWICDEVYKISHRQYTKGFYFGIPEQGQNDTSGGYIRNYNIIATVDYWKDGFLYCTQRNRFSKNDDTEILIPNKAPINYKMTSIIDEDGCDVACANRGQMKFKISYPENVPQYTVIRKNMQENH